MKTIATKIGSGKTPLGGGDSYQRNGVKFLRSQNIHFGGLQLDDIVYIDEGTHRQMRSSAVRGGDALLNITGASLGRVTRVPPEFGEANVNQHVCVIRPSSEVDSSFLAYSLSSLSTQSQIHALQVGGNRDGLNFEQVGNLSVPLPDLEEQRRVAAFLDAETRRIRAVVYSRKRQLALLQEGGLGAAFQAVKGTDQSGPRRSSGIPWLGDVPEHWGVAAVSHQFEVKLGKMLNQEHTQGKHLRPYLRNTNVQWDRLDTSDLLMMNFPPSERTRYEVRPGDLLVCEGGEPGRAAIWNGSISEVYYQKALHRVRSLGQSSVRWLYYCLRVASFRNAFAIQGNTTTISHLTGEQLQRQRFPFPERSAQDQLVTELDLASLHRQQLAGMLDRQLELLAEREQTLITVAVAGQLDVATARGVDVS